MIIFDTNAVDLLPPEGPRADIIRKLRQSRHHRVAVPWMVLEEMAAHQAKFYPDRYQTVVNTIAKLRDILPWDLESSLETLDLERFLDHWRTIYSEIFEVIETSGEVARKALAREAMAIPPAKRAKDHSEGARDVAIWFSILEFLEQNPDEEVCFVTANTSDFGDGTTYPYPMNEDVRGLEKRLTRLTDFNEVVSRFTKEVSGKDAEDAARQLLKSKAVRERVAQTAVEALSSPAGFAGLGAADEAVEWREWLASPEAELVSVTDVTGHEIESDVWYTANAQWLLYGLALNGDEADAHYIACRWQMKVLFSATDGDETPTVLASEDPSPPDTGDEPCMKILQDLKKRVAGVAVGAKRNLAAAQSSGDRFIAEQLSPSLHALDLTTNQIARKLAADQAAMQALVNGPAQQLARKVAADRAAMQALVNGPAQQLARKLAADRAAMEALINNPLQRLTRQIADAMPKLDFAVPKLNVAVPNLNIAVPRLNLDEDVSTDDIEQLESSGAVEEEPEDEADIDGGTQGS
ncbi:PIN domain-containing protein [Streptomyces sp. NPDC058656]|uniref:PIN domain-containing protein n=1 Tax=unclassified Streptomyces TaxID=2593676 RepID=UPI0036555938